MRRVLATAIVAASLLAGCETKGPSLGDAIPDPGPQDVPGDTALPDVPDDTGPRDAFDADGTGDVPADALADTPPDTTPDTAPDACSPVACALFCPHGFAMDASGCEICACRDCQAAKDCTSFPYPCDTPFCSESGTCLCDCTTQVPQDYACPDGTLVPWCACGPLGRDCIARPEERCPSLCNPGQAEPYPCADGSTVPWCSCARDDCVPECRNGGTDAEGWYDPCTDAPIANRACQSCRPFCQAIGTRSEGWYDDCGGGRIEWAFCAPRRTCDDNAPGACPDSACTPLDPPVTWACPDGTAVPECACDKGTWACAATPWAGCTDHATPCVGEGGGTRLSNPSQCCPGFAMIGAASWDGAQCQYPDCLCALCTYCGDGHCVPPENRCNCPDDCMP